MLAEGELRLAENEQKFIDMRDEQRHLVPDGPLGRAQARPHPHPHPEPHPHRHPHPKPHPIPHPIPHPGPHPGQNATAEAAAFAKMLAGDQREIVDNRKNVTGMRTLAANELAAAARERAEAAGLVEQAQRQAKEAAAAREEARSP